MLLNISHTHWLITCTMLLLVCRQKVNLQSGSLLHGNIQRESTRPAGPQGVSKPAHKEHVTTTTVTMTTVTMTTVYFLQGEDGVKSQRTQVLGALCRESFEVGSVFFSRHWWVNVGGQQVTYCGSHSDECWEFPFPRCVFYCIDTDWLWCRLASEWAWPGVYGRGLRNVAWELG